MKQVALVLLLQVIPAPLLATKRDSEPLVVTGGQVVFPLDFKSLKLCQNKKNHHAKKSLVAIPNLYSTLMITYHNLPMYDIFYHLGSQG